MESKQKVVGVIGCGYVGLTTAVVLANSGFQVRAIEINLERLKAIQAGHSFFYETGIDNLLLAGLKNGSLVATDSYQEGLTDCEVVISCVGTPDNPDGSSNLSYIFDAAKRSAAVLRPGTIFIQRSTVPVGTGQKIIELFTQAGADLRYVSSPEFLREGTAIKDTLWPDRVVSGSPDRAAAEQVNELYKQISNQRESVASLAGIETPTTPQSISYVITDLNSAELIKVTANAFLALKISFANSIAKLADSAGADINEVMNGVGADRRIGRAFLSAGRGFGGGCFPKDVSGLIRSAEDFGVNLEIMNVASEVNDSMPHYIIHKAKRRLGDFGNKQVAVLGLAFKAGTSDTRRSPAVAIANTLAQQGAVVSAYDPEAITEAKHVIADEVRLCQSLTEAVTDADCIFIATDWSEFVTMDLSLLNKAALVVDCMNCLPPAAIKQLGKKYMGVGRDGLSL